MSLTCDFSLVMIKKCDLVKNFHIKISRKLQFLLNYYYSSHHSITIHFFLQSIMHPVHCNLIPPTQNLAAKYLDSCKNKQKQFFTGSKTPWQKNFILHILLIKSQMFVNSVALKFRSQKNEMKCVNAPQGIKHIKFCVLWPDKKEPFCSSVLESKKKKLATRVLEWQPSKPPPPAHHSSLSYLAWLQFGWLSRA